MDRCTLDEYVLTWGLKNSSTRGALIIVLPLMILK